MNSITIENYEKLYALHLEIEAAKRNYEEVKAYCQTQIGELVQQTENYLPEGHDPEKWLKFRPSTYGRIKDGDFHFYKA